jgi:hypothetical protein
MIDFRSLDRETRTVALVGRFLQLWSAMEVAIGRAIGTALGSNNLEQFILLKNISFTQKLNILGALCYVSRLSFDERENAKQLLTDIFNCYFRRNHVAHDQFVASKDTDGVEFIVIRARREKVTMPSVDWSIADFESNFSEIVRFSLAIAELSKKLRRSLSTNALAELAATLSYAPTEGYTGLGSLGLLFPQPLAPQPLDRTPPTPETDPETPSTPEK